MATSYPASIDTTNLTNPATTDKRNSPSHAGLHANANDAIKAVETKVGTGSSTPVVSTLLFGTGTGTSAWQGLTSAQLAAVLSDETGTGSAVFGTTPTLVTPKIDTINEFTAGNGTTIGGVNIKNGALNTSNSVVTSNITNAAVTANKLATGAAYSYVATTETTTSLAYTVLATAGPAVTVTIGANGLALIIISARMFNNTATDFAYMGFDISGATTRSAATPYEVQDQSSAINVPDHKVTYTVLLTGLTAGTTTFTMKYRAGTGGTANFGNREISVIPL